MQRDSLQCDVLVVGGGAAGVAAAVGASRSGANVVLVEKYGFMGGMATAGMVSSVCGFYIRSRKGVVKTVSGGFVEEFAGELSARQQVEPMVLQNGLVILPFDPWHFIRLTDKYINESSIHPLLHSQITSVRVEGRSVAEVECLTWNSFIKVLPECVIDCTGESIVVDWAGGETVKTAAQDASVLFKIDGLHLASQGERIAMMRKIIHAADNGIIHYDCRNISFVPGHTEGRSTLLNVPISRKRDEVNSITDLELHGRMIVEEVTRVLVSEAYIPSSSCPMAAAQVGIRVGRLAKGRAQLGVDHVLSCRKDEDGVARGCWPVEIWNGGRKPEVTYLPEGDYYDIPAGCLVAEKLDNMFMAGRCISADDRAMGSARVIGTALGTGYAAGTLAAFQAQGKKQRDAISLLQQQQEQ